MKNNPIYNLLIALLSLLAVKSYAQTGWPEAQRQPIEERKPANLITSRIAFDQKLGAEIPASLVFRDETGKEVRLADYFGKRPIILTLVYYECPMLCTQELNGLLTALRTISYQPGKDFDILTVSIDPHETPDLAMKKKKSYLASYNRDHAAEGWHFLTGAESSITSLTQSAGFHAVYDSLSHQFAHATGILILTPEGKISRYFFGIEYAPRDLKFALIEASGNKIGSLADKLLLYCYHYDPTKGKYGAWVMNIMRIGGIIAIIVVTALIIFLKPRRVKTIPAQ
jgi:protein SCO1/2